MRADRLDLDKGRAWRAVGIGEGRGGGWRERQGAVRGAREGGDGGEGLGTAGREPKDARKPARGSFVDQRHLC